MVDSHGPADDQIQPKVQWFSKQKILWHFGRFRGDSPQPSPRNQILVGREKQRSDFIRQLLNLPKRSTFLITGNRGSGKTRFVDHCLNTYEENLLARYMRTDAGRAIFWDKISLFFLLTLVASTIPLLREINYVVFTSIRFPFILFAAPLLVLGCFPLIYGTKLIAQARKVDTDRKYKPFTKGSVNSASTAIATSIFFLTILLGLDLAILLVSASLYINYFCRICTSDTNSKKPFVLIALSSIFTVGNYALIIYSRYDPDISQWYLIVPLIIVSLLTISSICIISRDDRVSKRSNKTALYCYAAYITPLLSTLLEPFTQTPYTIPAFCVSILLLILALSSQSNQTDESLLVDSKKVIGPLRALFFIKAIFLFSLTTFLFQPSVEWIWSETPDFLSYYTNYFGNFSFPSFPDLSELSHAHISIPILLVAFFVLEYDLIILPYGYRLFISNKNPKWRTESQDHGEPTSKEEGRKSFLVNRPTYLRYTFFWIIFNAWLPIITIRINLGFDSLDYRRVVEAMLLGLKNEFHKQFMSFRSIFANLIRLVFLLGFAYLSSIIGHFWFGTPSQAYSTTTNATRPYSYPDAIYKPIDDQSRHASAKHWVKSLPLFVQEMLYWKIIAKRLNEPSDGFFNNLRRFLPYNIQPHMNSPSNRQKLFVNNSLQSELNIYLYNILIFLFLYVLYLRLRTRTAFFPYHKCYRGMNEMLSRFSSRTSGSTERSLPFSLTNLGSNVSNRKSWEAEPLDPRTLELELISLLKSAQMPAIPLLRSAEHKITLPQSEVTFIFDELDKLGVRAFWEKPEEEHPQEHLILEKRRNIAIQELLANMKNLLSSGSARFIFIGGRDIHDEWHADRAQRIPFLTNIFDAEIYLPSLLTDHPPYRYEAIQLNSRIKEYLLVHFNSGLDHWDDMKKHRFLSVAEHHQREYAENCFNDFPVDEAKGFFSYSVPENNNFKIYVDDIPLSKKDKQALTIKDEQTSSNDAKQTSSDNDKRTSFESEIPESHWKDKFAEQFKDDFLNFLTFRSYGNPKMLGSLMNSFMVNQEGTHKKSDDSSSDFKSGKSEFLTFDYESTYRVQMISAIYRVIANRFEKKLLFGDDKPVVTLFYVVNFLLKFHRRAFSWNSLEQVDELVHIHKSLETRQMIKEVIDEWTDRYLDHIRNGIFDFRYGQDIASELRFLSRTHLDEMAAVNFTLDESRHLKALYHRLIESSSGDPNYEYLSVLGELHEYDGDFLYARGYFRKAVNYLDKDFFSNPMFEKLHLDFNPLRASDRENDEIASNLLFFIHGLKTNNELLQTAITWATVRLRFMIRIAMTYELAKNLEGARFGYRAAAHFAKATFDAWTQSKDKSLLHLTKTLNILFLPTFAEAWAMEKSASTLDAGVSLVEQELEKNVRILCKIIKDNPKPEQKHVLTHINFYVVLAELYHKLGDMFFTKGKNIISPPKFDPNRSHNNATGFLSMALTQYIRGIYFLLLYFRFRFHQSGLKYNNWPPGKKPPKITFSSDNYPVYYNRVFLGIVRDSAFTIMAKTSFSKLVLDRKDPFIGMSFTSNGIEEQALSIISKLQDSIDNFIVSLNFPLEPHQEDDQISTTIHHLPFIEYLANSQHQESRENLYLSLSLQLLASHQLEQNGYPGKAIRSYTQTAETIQHHLEWFLIFLLFTSLEKEEAIPEGQKELKSSFKIKPQIWRKLINGLLNLGFFSLNQVTKISKNNNRVSRSAQNHFLYHGLAILANIFEGLGMDIVTKYRKPVPDPADKPPQSNVDAKKNSEPLRFHFSRIREICFTNLFPFRSRLRGLKTYSDCYILQRAISRLIQSGEITPNLFSMNLTGDDTTQPENNKLVEWSDQLETLQKELSFDLNEINRELHFLDQQYNHDSIYSPFYQGVTFFLTHYYYRHIESQPSKCDEWEAQAANYLNRCHQMMTQGRAYYEFISNQYFLYEDFNDREFQFGHAIQMAGSGVIAFMRNILEANAKLPNSQK